MIRVILLASGPGAAQPRVLVKAEQKPAMIGLAMLLVTGLGVGGWWYYISSQTASTETAIITAESRIEQLKDAMKLLEKARSQKTELEGRLALIEQLRQSKSAPVKLLNVLNESVPEGLWLMEIKQTSAAITIEGRAMSQTSVSDYAKSLQDSGFFKMPVEVVMTLMETVEETNVFRFLLKAVPVATVPATSATTPAGRPGV